MKADPAKVIAAVNKLRATFSSVPSTACRLQDDPILGSLPIVKNIVADIKCSPADTIKLTKTKQHINKAKDNFVLSLFNAQYFPSLGLDGFFYELLKVNASLSKNYISPVMPVKILEASEGFHSDRVVALFPENHIDGTQNKEDAIFYFIDKFVSRYFHITKPLLDIAVDPNCLLELRQSDEQKIETAAVYWVWLHEYYHRQGFLPIPQYLHLKSTRALAGLEEMRVDMCSLMALLNDKTLPARDTKLAFQFILAERLLRYPIEGDDYPTYDAIGSQLLFNYLIQKSGICIQQERICFTNDLVPALQLFMTDIAAIESNVHLVGEDAVKNNLTHFVKHYACYDSRLQRYVHADFYQNLRHQFISWKEHDGQ